MKQSKESTNKSIKYAEELIQHIESDKRSTLLFVLFDLGLLSVTINILYRPEKFNFPCPIKFLLTVSLLLICVSTYLLFKWYRILHIERLRVTAFFKDQNLNKIQYFFDRHENHKLWKQEGWRFDWGWCFLVSGVVGYILVAIAMLWNRPQ